MNYKEKLNELENKKYKEVDELQYALLLAIVERCEENDFDSSTITQNDYDDMANDLWCEVDENDELEYGCSVQGIADDIVDRFIEDKLEEEA